MANKYFTVGKGIQAGGKKIVEGLKKVLSKKQPTITGMKPTKSLTGKNQFLMDKMQKKLSKDTGEMIKFRNQRSKELFKKK